MSVVPAKRNVKGQLKRKNASVLGNKLVQSAIANAALGALGNVSPSVGRAARGAYGLYKLFRTKSGTSAPRMGSTDQAYYAGKFNKKLRKAKGENKFITQGVVETRETGWIQQDDHCVYVGHGTIAIKTALQITMQAIIKKLLKIAFKYDVINVTDVLPDFDYNTDVNIQLWRTNVYTGQEDGSQIIPIVTNTSTVKTLAVSAATYIMETISAQNESFMKYSEIRLYGQSGATVNIRASLDLWGLKVHYFAQSNFKVQNSTLAADAAGDTNTDNALDVNNVPLQGKHYTGYSSHTAYRGCNRTSTVPSLNFNTIVDPVNAYIYIQGASTANGYDQLKEPPHYKMFLNCKGQAGVRLQPGSMKKNSLTSNYTMFFNTWLAALNFKFNNAQSTDFNNALKTRIGKWSLIALEKMLHSTSNKVIVRCEVNLKHGCYVELGKKPPTSQDFTTQLLGTISS